MYYKTGIPVNSEAEFLASEKVVAFTGTVSDEGVAADEYGRKIVHKGTLLSAEGKAVGITVADGSISGAAARTATATFSAPPAGILMDAVDVTYGPQPGAYAVECYAIGQRLHLGTDYTEAIGAAIHDALPEIKFVKRGEGV